MQACGPFGKDLGNYAKKEVLKDFAKVDAELVALGPALGAMATGFVLQQPVADELGCVQWGDIFRRYSSSK